MGEAFVFDGPDSEDLSWLEVQRERRKAARPLGQRYRAAAEAGATSGERGFSLAFKHESTIITTFTSSH